MTVKRWLFGPAPDVVGGSWASPLGKSPRKLHQALASVQNNLCIVASNGLSKALVWPDYFLELDVKQALLPLPKHIAIIMDGNGRWAQARNRPRHEGHLEGAKAVRHAVETASRIGIEFLTLYAFSANNWARPCAEVEALMALMVDFAHTECAELRQNGIRVRVIGQSHRLPDHTRNAVTDLVRATADGTRMTLTLALSYGARQDVLQAVSALAEQAKNGDLDLSRLDNHQLRAAMTTHYLPDVDLLIRTGGESRVSDFLLLEAAYAELLFLPNMWPEFKPETLYQAIDHYRGLERRYGLTSEQVQTDGTISTRPPLIRAALG